MTGPPAFEMVRHRPSPPLDTFVRDICGYREISECLIRQREAANLVVPLIISFGAPFRIALGREPGAGDRQPSFAAGLYAGPVHIESDGGAECIQVDFTPLGAYRLLGAAVADLSGRMVDIVDVLGPQGHYLRDRLGETVSWQARIELVEQFVAARAIHRPSPEIAFAYRHLKRSGGQARISDLSREIGWSRKHFAHRFAAEIGLGPKAVARMIRFHHACRLALAGSAGWARIAADAGYSDQAHLVREFGELAGETPSAWVRRIAGMEPDVIDRMNWSG